MASWIRFYEFTLMEKRQHRVWCLLPESDTHKDTHHVAVVDEFGRPVHFFT